MNSPNRGRKQILITSSLYQLKMLFVKNLEIDLNLNNYTIENFFNRFQKGLLMHEFNETN